MSRSTTTRLAALGAAATLVLIPVAATSADPVISQASGNAIHLEIGGNEVYDSGTVRATNDGSGEVKTGEVNPPIGALANQDLLNIGALAQDAAADVNGRNGVSKACAGVAGEGAQVVEVGDSNCITPGQPVDITFGNLDLTDAVVFTPGSALEGLNGLTDPIIAQLIGPLTAAIEQGLADFADTGLGGTLGAVEARCTANPDSAQGRSNIVDTALTLTLGNETIELVKFPANPPPNTKLLTDLDVVLNTIIDALKVDINETLDAQLAPLQLIIDPIQEQIVNNLIAQIAPDLAPLEENILDVTLNKQSPIGNGGIAVTAIDLKLLPAAQQFGQLPLVDTQIANVTCGPNGRLGVDNPDGPDGPNGPGGPDGPNGPGGPGLPDVPTAVDSGVEGGGGSLAPWLLVGLAALTGAGAYGWRRQLLRG